jgi:hypothetical protein
VADRVRVRQYGEWLMQDLFNAGRDKSNRQDAASENREEPQVPSVNHGSVNTVEDMFKFHVSCLQTSTTKRETTGKKFQLS